MSNILPTIIKTRNILHRLTLQETGPRITEEQYIQMPNGSITVAQFWRHDSGELIRVTQRSLIDGEEI